MWNRKRLKAKGLAAFKANYWKCVLIGFLLTLFLAGTSASVSRTARPATNPNGYTVITDGTHTAVVDNVTMGQIQQAVAENEFAIAMQDPAFRSMVRATLAAVGAALSLILLVLMALALLVINFIMSTAERKIGGKINA